MDWGPMEATGQRHSQSPLVVAGPARAWSVSPMIQGAIATTSWELRGDLDYSEVSKKSMIFGKNYKYLVT